MKGFAMFVLLILFAPRQAFCGTYEDGYALFMEGNLAEATRVWENALEGGSGSAELHYNLGVAQYRKGEVAKAIAHWRMGRILSPRDANMVHNLAVARSELVDVLEPVDTHPPLLQVATADSAVIQGPTVRPASR